MPRETILIIEDERNILELLDYNLSQEGYAVLKATDGSSGLELARQKKPGLILLDLMLPELDGLEVCKILKQNDKTASIPIIMLTAKSQEMDKVVGLEIGADDYMTKPFSPRELMARIKAVLRRGRESLSEQNSFRVGEIELDDTRHVVSLKGEPLDLTSKEYDLLKALIQAKGRALSRDQLLEKVWGYAGSVNIETRTVDMHIGQIRKKIKSEANRIVTVKNVGYRLEP